jgi:CBS-domain-containing membrane protein
VAAAITGLVGTDVGQRLLGGIGPLFAIEAALAVGLSMFLMAATDTEHPPAAGTALAVVTRGFTWELALFFVISILGLVVVHRLLRSRMRDLY